MKFPGVNLRVFLSFIGVCALAGVVRAQPAGQLSAREIFYGAATPAPDAKSAKAAPAAPKSPAPKAQTAAKQAATPQPTATAGVPAVAAPQTAPQTTPARQATAPPAAVAAASPAPLPAAPPAAPPSQQASTPVSNETSSGGRREQAAPLKLAAYTRQPLGIRLSLLKVEQNGDRKEVAPDTNFAPGDRVRLSIQVATQGYLYIVNRGSSGTWTQLFPSPDLPSASNALMPGTTYSIPADRNFVISNPPGNEKMFLILSRQPVADVASLILDMSRRANGAAAPQAEPKAPSRPAPQMMADSRGPINDAAVDRMRTFYARDLIIETVDQKTPGATKEDAVYAVTTGDGDDARVVLDAQIRHQ